MITTINLKRIFFLIISVSVLISCQKEKNTDDVKNKKELSLEGKLENVKYIFIFFKTRIDLWKDNYKE